MKNMGLLIGSFLLLIGFLSSTYTVPEHQQALVVELGKVKGKPVTEAGLHMKLPLIQDVRYFEKRLLQWDGEKVEIPTLDKKFILADTTARWKIKDALVFYRAVRDVNNAMLRMGTILDGITKDTISHYRLLETVRNTNDIFQDIQNNRKEAERLLLVDATDTTLDELSTDVDQITTGREKLSQIITERAQKDLENFGIELVDVQIRSVAYKEVVEEKVYSRMISERMKIADKIRSTGQGERAKILGQLDLALKKVESEAYRKSQEIRGKAEAEAINIFTLALQADTEFYGYIKALDTYKDVFGKNTHFLLSTESGFLDVFNKGP
jgi:membrane protease subunit HflC